MAHHTISGTTCQIMFLMLELCPFQQQGRAPRLLVWEATSSLVSLVEMLTTLLKNALAGTSKNPLCASLTFLHTKRDDFVGARNVLGHSLLTKDHCPRQCKYLTTQNLEQMQKSKPNLNLH